MRLDRYLAENGLAESRTRARALVEASLVLVNGKVEKKPSFDVCDGDVVTLSGTIEYVSRGEMKLSGAMEHFAIDVRDARALDIGASSGGFTDCLLKHGARHVHAVDAGSGQLSPRLAADARVTSVENYNARYMKPDDFPYPMDVVTMDVSFISQRLILPGVRDVLAPGGILISLIKPQFEVGRAHIGGGGIVRDEGARLRAVEDVVACASSCGLTHLGTMTSPITGGDGNVEYLAYFRKENV